MRQNKQPSSGSGGLISCTCRRAESSDPLGFPVRSCCLPFVVPGRDIGRCPCTRPLVESVAPPLAGINASAAWVPFLIFSDPDQYCWSPWATRSRRRRYGTRTRPCPTCQLAYRKVRHGERGLERVGGGRSRRRQGVEGRGGAATNDQQHPPLPSPHPHPHLTSPSPSP